MSNSQPLKGIRVIKWTENDLNNAIEDVKTNGNSIYSASKKFNIPLSTLQLKIKGWKDRPPSTSSKVGAKPSLPAELELDLVECIKTLNKGGFGFNKQEVLDMLQIYFNQNGIKTKFTNNRPGNAWWDGFKKRHKISLKKPERIESARTRQSGDPFVVKGAYALLLALIKELQLQDKPECVWNCDETGLNHDPGSGATKVVCVQGEAAKRQTGGSGKENTTMMGCGNAAGDEMPPGILFKGIIFTKFFYNYYFLYLQYLFHTIFYRKTTLGQYVGRC